MSSATPEPAPAGPLGLRARWTSRVGPVASYRWWPVAVGVGVVAFGMRLGFALSRNLLRAYGHDQSVYYTAAIGLSTGRLPYRDFLLLHPPGIVVLLTPFAWLGSLVGDPRAIMIAQAAFMVMGAGSAVLVAWMVRSHGWLASLVAGLLYAVGYQAVYAESSTWLEAPGSFFLLLGMALLVTIPADRPIPARRALLAGLALGLSPTFKIWTVIPALAVVAWLLVTRRFAPAWQAVVGAAVGMVAVMLPFFATAPGQMWQMVVSDQLGRPEARFTLPLRLFGILGFYGSSQSQWSIRLALGCLVVLLAAVVAATSRVGRFAVWLSVVTVAVLLTSPTWFTHYPTLSAGPLAMMVGIAVGLLVQVLPRSWQRWTSVGVVVALAGTLAWYAHSEVFSQRRVPAFNGAKLAEVAEDWPGCVTTNEPMTLLSSGLMRRNLADGCELMVDLRGHYYHLREEGGTLPARTESTAYQQFVLDYLRTGAISITIQDARSGFSHDTIQTMKTWPAVAKVGSSPVRQPQP